ncbi:HAD family phosphatase [Aerococcus agrisoli]|uniref:HAD family phosphatase n=1 Tax=Aerococcus agrisoli TaxID=2487350 RepID=A0A3N4GEU7_9LACT|nr:Cof-type HAD-IIB family hydrolase [Aerococcus agrisoli]RPA57120.1 HAD family phosphatase [Aerococcus agrisoli]
MIELIAIDLDGTLLSKDKTISPANIDMIHKAIQNGVDVAICTGRPLEAIQHILDTLGTNSSDHYSITYNGGLVLKNESREVVSQVTMSMGQAQCLYEAMLAVDLPLEAVLIDAVYQFPFPEDFPGTYQETMNFLPFKQFDMTNLDPETAIFKVVINTEIAHLESAMTKLPEWVFEDFEVMRSHPYQLEIMPKGVDKGVGVAHLAQVLELTADQVMVIGDEENDLAMLKWAGTAVVMENGRPDIKQYADYITSSNEEDGVAKAIDHFVFYQEDDNK